MELNKRLTITSYNCKQFQETGFKFDFMSEVVTLNAIVKEVQCDHVRLCGVFIYIADQSILVINAYMPYDNYVKDANYYEYIDVLNEIERLIISIRQTTQYWVVIWTQTLLG